MFASSLERALLRLAANSTPATWQGSEQSGASKHPDDMSDNIARHQSLPPKTRRETKHFLISFLSVALLGALVDQQSTRKTSQPLANHPAPGGESSWWNLVDGIQLIESSWGNPVDALSKWIQVAFYSKSKLISISPKNKGDASISSTLRCSSRFKILNLFLRSASLSPRGTPVET